MSSSQLTMERAAPLAPATPSARPQRSRGAITLAVILACQLMLVLDATIVNIALPKIQQTLHFTSSNLSWVLNGYTLAFGGLLLLGGRAGDIWGRKRFFMAGLALFTLASFLGGFATSAAWLVISRATQGIGAAMAAPSALALIATNFPEGPERNRALSYFSAVSSAGGSIGLLMGGMLTSWVSWRWVLFVNVPIGIAVILLASRFITESPRQRARLDVAGALTSTAGMVLLVYGVIRSASNGWGDSVARGSIALAVVLLVGFVLIERRVGQPVMPLHLFNNRNRSGAYISVMLTVASMFGVFFFLTQYLQTVMGFSPVETGVAFLPLTALIFATSRLVPRLIPVFGPRRIMLAGGSLILLSAFWLTHITVSTSYMPNIIGPMVLLGIGVGSSFLPLSIMVLSGVPGHEAGAASGILQTMQQMGGALGVSVLISVFSGATRTVAVSLLARETPLMRAHIVFAHSLATAFVASTIFATASLVIAVLVLRESPTTATVGTPVQVATEV